MVFLFYLVLFKTHFLLGSPTINLFKSLFSSFADALMSHLTKNRDALSANTLTFDDKLSEKSLI